MNKSNLKAIFAKGHIHFMLKETRSALKCYKKLQKLDDNYSKILKNVIPILKLMSNKNYGDALIILNAYLRDENNNFFLNYLQGIILNYLGNVDLAFYFFNKGRELQKEEDGYSESDPDLILFHSYFYVYDRSLVDHCMQNLLKKNKTHETMKK
jgi:tetratricopeptide (TPR) repeat protein